jgi:hypothetical protein
MEVAGRADTSPTAPVWEGEICATLGTVLPPQGLRQLGRVGDPVESARVATAQA